MYQSNNRLLNQIMQVSPLTTMNVHSKGQHDSVVGCNVTKNRPNGNEHTDSQLMKTVKY